MVRFYSLRILKDYVSHVIMLSVIGVIAIMVLINQDHVPTHEFSDMALYIGLIFIIMFMGFGAAYTFEGLYHDFFKPFRQRLFVAPVSPMKFVYANVISSIITSFVQALIMLLFIVLAYDVQIHHAGLVVVVLLLGIVAIQFFATFLMFMIKSSFALVLMTVFVTVSFIIGGFFFSFKQTAFTVFLSKFSSPFTWVRYAIYGFMNGDSNEGLVGVSLLVGFIVLLLIIISRVIRRVIV